MDDSRRNVLLLALCQALFMTCNSLVITTAALVGLSLAPVPAMATLPVGLMFASVMLSTLPASLLMRRVGRRAGLLGGAVAGVLGGLVCAAGIVRGGFTTFCVGMVLYGVFSSFGQYYRFAAADAAADGFKSRAISLVMAGGIVAAFAGPNLARVTRELLSSGAFAGGYASVAVLAAGCALVVSRITIPRPEGVEREGPARPLARIARSPVFVVAVLGAMIAYGSMNLVMTSTPLAMQGHGHAFGATATVIQWHVLGMFAPSFFTGRLIHRFGSLRVMGAGAVLLLGCVLVNLSGASTTHFWSALLALGVGWNFLFIGATTLLTDAYAPAEKAKAQGLNDLLVFSVVAVSATSSGALHALLGWTRLNLVVLPGIAVAIAACAWLALRRRDAVAMPAPGARDQ